MAENSRREFAKRAVFTRVRLEFGDGNACELIGDDAQKWHEDMFHRVPGQWAIAASYPWKAAFPIGTTAVPPKPAKDVEEWADGEKDSRIKNILWETFARLFYIHEQFDPNRRDRRALELFSWFYRGVLFVSTGGTTPEAPTSPSPSSASEAPPPAPPSPGAA